MTKILIKIIIKIIHCQRINLFDNSNCIISQKCTFIL